MCGKSNKTKRANIKNGWNTWVGLLDFKIQNARLNKINNVYFECHNAEICLYESILNNNVYMHHFDERWVNFLKYWFSKF